MAGGLVPALAALADVLARRPGLPATVDPAAPAPRRAAVALVLRPAAGPPAGLELLFVRRAEYPGDPWSGHVAFPGGRHESGDATPWHTAARETREETGLDLARDGVLLGTLDDLYPRTPTLPPVVVRPHVVAAAAREPLVLSDELAAAFWVPVDRFGAPGVAAAREVVVRGGRLSVPSYAHDGHVIWGMTERMLAQLLDRLGLTAP